MRTISLFFALTIAMVSAPLQARESEGASQPHTQIQTQTQSTESVLVDRIVAVANEEVVLYSELQHAVDQLVARMEGKAQLPPRPVLKRQVLNQLIMTKLQLQLAASNDIQVSANEVDAAIQRMARRNGITVSRLRRRIIQGGYNFAAFRQDMREQLIIRKLQRRVINSRVKVTDSEVQIQLNRMPRTGKAYHLASILISLPEGAGPEQIRAAMAHVKDLYRQIRGGRSFAEVALAESDAPNALRGGDMGWMRSVELPGAFANIIKELRVGEVSRPIRTPRGLYIVKLLAEREAKPIIVQEVQARQILIEINGLTTSEEAYEQVKDLRDRIVNGGAAFAEIARKYSDAIENAARGGNMGWFVPKSEGRKFQQALSGLKPGEVSYPFRTDKGWQIVKLLDTRKVNHTEEQRAQRARTALFRRKARNQLERWKNQMRGRAYIDIRL